MSCEEPEANTVTAGSTWHKLTEQHIIQYRFQMTHGRECAYGLKEERPILPPPHLAVEPTSCDLCGDDGGMHSSCYLLSQHAYKCVWGEGISWFEGGRLLSHVLFVCIWLFQVYFPHFLREKLWRRERLLRFICVSVSQVLIRPCIQIVSANNEARRKSFYSGLVISGCI